MMKRNLNSNQFFYDKLFNTPSKHLISSSIGLSTLNELDILVIKHANCNALIALQGAHLMTWRPIHDPNPVVWLSELSPFEKGKAIRGGIPVCWPWFGPKATPSHGFARNNLWQISSTEENKEGVIISLTLQESAETLSIWPHKFNLTLKFTLGLTCKLELISQGNFDFTTALHSYFNLSNTSQAKVTGIGMEYIDSLQKNQKFRSENDKIDFTKHIDRIYTEPNQIIEINDSGFNRTIIIQSHHQFMNDVNQIESCEAVIWNPGSVLSSSMKDMTDEGYLNMGCVESAIISTPVELSNTIHNLTLEISSDIKITDN